MTVPVWRIHRAIGMGGDRTGGFGFEELRDTGAVAVYETLGQLRAALDELPFSIG